MKVILISGKAEHGKDTVANQLRDVLTEKGYSVLITHYADLLKYICKTFFAWNGEKDQYGRELLQYVGTDVVRKQLPNFWVDFVIQILSLFPNEWDYVLISDTRFPNEIERFNETDIQHWHLRVQRPGHKSRLTEEQMRHPSETALDHYPYDLCVHNFGTLQDMQSEINRIIPNIMP